jgi:hypothetical protein
MSAPAQWAREPLAGKPLAVDLFTGLHGWAEGLIAEGFDVIGVDLEDMSAQFGQPKPKGFSLVIQDVRTLHGSQFKDAALIVASPPCQAYSYRAMPWKRAKALPPPCNELFEACFRIQREACEAAGHHVPLIVENVRGAQKWVGRARWCYGAFALWGDVPALMPIRQFDDGVKQGGDWFNASQPSMSRLYGSKSPARKMASAMIAKIPRTLSRHIARSFLPQLCEAA